MRTVICELSICIIYIPGTHFESSINSFADMASSDGNDIVNRDTC